MVYRSLRLDQLRTVGVFDGDDMSKMALSIYSRNGVVAAVCHGPAALVNLKLDTGEYFVSGKNVAAFSDAEEEAAGLTGEVPFLLSSTLASRGAHLQTADNFESNAVTDGQLVTGQNPASATATAEAVVSALMHR
jgi:putative intracellular protease/amidase